MQMMFDANPAKAMSICGESTPQKIADDIFATLDKNGDQAINLEEFLEGAIKDSSIVQLLECREDEN